MGFLDKAKKSLTKAVDQHGDKIDKGVDQLGRTINTRTGGKHAATIAKGSAQLRKGLDGLDGRNDDLPRR
jgi:hypothetical protein